MQSDPVISTMWWTCPSERSECTLGQQCLRCQAESAQLRRIRREMSVLGSAPVGVPATLFDQILVALDRAEQSPSVLRRRTSTVAAATLGGIAAAAGVAALAARRRSSVRLAG